MARTRTLVAAAVLVAVAVVTSALASVRDTGAATPERAALAAPGRPNIVLILTDDMRADELRYLPKTRRLLVQQGVRFSNAISPHPVCCPARAELVTGQYGQNSGVKHNTGPWGGVRALNDLDANVGWWLQVAGYRTSFHGKFLNGYENLRPRVEPRGWSIWDAQTNGIYSYQHARFFDGDRVHGEYVTTTMTERSGGAIAQFTDDQAPFFTVINHIAPHVTVSTPHLPRWERKYDGVARGMRPPMFDVPSFNEADVRDLPERFQVHPTSRIRIEKLFGARVRALRSVDDAVAALVDQLEEAGELDNTYIVFTSDNGYALGEHRLSGKNYLFDEVLDIPLVIRGPGFEPGTESDVAVSLLDLVATFVDWAGATPGHPIDGISVERLLDRRRAERDTILVQTGDAVADSTPGWDFRGVSTGRYLFAYRAGNLRNGILFDRQLDPYALRNRFRDRAYQGIRLELTRRTRILSRCSGADCNRLFGALPPLH